MSKELIWLRVKSFFISLGTLVGFVLLGLLASEDFAGIVVENFGSGLVSTLILLLAQEAVKHFRNVRVVGKARLGGHTVGAFDLM
jgi:hypothetical protein